MKESETEYLEKIEKMNEIFQERVDELCMIAKRFQKINDGFLDELKESRRILKVKHDELAEEVSKARGALRNMEGFYDHIRMAANLTENHIRNAFFIFIGVVVLFLILLIMVGLH